MKKYFSLILICLFSLGMLNAQTSFKLNPNPKSEPLNFNSGDTLKVLAVMVEFQEDNDGNTFGDGKFGSIYSQDYGTDILDPLPHNANYFENHLLFAKNYFEKVSEGSLNISYTVMPNIITVSKIIREYSPPAQSDDFTALGDFAQEVWGLADQSMQINFADYDLFTIFHAGVGREIPTPGSIGLERDIPSVFLSENTLKGIFGNEFAGFPVNDGSFSIQNTAILPATENREIESFGETFLQEFSINGLLVGTIASYIGLPDLFNTETGTSAIGRFGLMDGQALFAYSGLFPPEPSAWEKIYLGWITPTEVSLENQTINLTTYETAVAGDETLIKIPINADEYYLIENRKRDANKDGAIITYKVGNSTNSITFDKDYPAFSPFGADTLIGVITDIDEFDWAMPAFEEEQTFDDSFEDVGFIIWHIDESVIRNNIESNTVNNNRDRLGVRVVEADGIFDIGEEFLNIFGETVIGEGTKQDTWYQNNPSEFYENEFNSTTKPPAVSNLGANSLISISNISAISNTMSFDLSTNSSSVSLVFNKFVPANTSQIISASEFIAVRQENGSVSLLNNLGDLIYQLSNFSIVDAASASTEGANYLVGASSDSLKLYEKGIVLQYEKFLGIPLSSIPSAPIVINQNQLNTEIIVGLQNGSIAKYSYDGASFTTISESVAFTNEPVQQVVSSNGMTAAISDTKYWDADGTLIDLPQGINQLAIVSDGSGPTSSVVLTDNTYYVIVDGQIDNSFKVVSTNAIESFSVADLKGDGNNYIIFNNGNEVEARNLSGASASLFPVKIGNSESLLSTPIIVDYKGAGTDDIITYASNGNIYAISGSSAEVLNPFPINAGNYNSIQPIVSNFNDTRLGFVSESVSSGSNLLTMWKLSDTQLSVKWGNAYGSFNNNAYVSAAGNSNEETAFFPKDAAYNWPNPVYGDETNIRFFVNENSNAEIKIFDLAGDLVAELSGSATGGMDNEITWNVSNIQSGVYVAHINVESSTGKSDSKLIKIAVIK